MLKQIYICGVGEGGAGEVARRWIIMPNNSKGSANECKTGPFSLMRKLHEPKSFLLIRRKRGNNKHYVAVNDFPSAGEFPCWHFF